MRLPRVAQLVLSATLLIGCATTPATDPATSAALLDPASGEYATTTLAAPPAKHEIAPALGVAHRGDPKLPQDPKAASGYVTEEHATRTIEAAGFRLVARSQINANPKDTKDYEKGVWTLPPGFADGDRPRYKQIGESDRFTLKFVKSAP